MFLPKQFDAAVPATRESPGEDLGRESPSRQQETHLRLPRSSPGDSRAAGTAASNCFGRNIQLLHQVGFEIR